MKSLSKIFKRMNKKILVLAVFLVGILGFLVWQGEKVKIVTDRIEYEKGGVLRLKIKNCRFKSICFSSCYPYYLERNNGAWKPYRYQDCTEPDLAETCIEPGKTKAFEITLPLVKAGFHRLALPACLGCRRGEEFRENNRFYSNQFEIR